MSYQEDSIDWQAIQNIDDWIDEHIPDEYSTQPLAQDWARISKISKIAGEAVGEFIKLTGQNPRKGYCSTYVEVFDELAHCAIASITAIQHFTKNSSVTKGILKQEIMRIEKKINE